MTTSLLERRLAGLAAREPTIREIAAEVAARRGLDLRTLLTSGYQKGGKAVSAARHEAMAAAYATGRFSNLEIARVFRLRDHAAVVHARRRVAERAREPS
jgi:chromosomal replication initiation ATPase DnaA